MTKAPENASAPPPIAAPPPEEMSTLISRRKIREWAEVWQNRLPLWLWDRLYWFVIQTKLLFSVTIILIVGALMLLFIWATIGLAFAMSQGMLQNEGASLAQLSHGVLWQMAIFLTIVMHMNQWEVERDDRTFELLIMRLPNIHRLIWFKLFVSISWVFILIIPLYVGLSLFADISLMGGVSVLIFTLMSALLVGLATCVVASFVHHPLATGIITVILTFVGAAILDIPVWPKPYAYAFQLFIFPPDLFDPEKIKDSLQIWYAIANRAFFLFAACSIYWWLYRRLSQTEKWI